MLKYEVLLVFLFSRGKDSFLKSIFIICYFSIHLEVFRITSSPWECESPAAGGGFVFIYQIGLSGCTFNVLASLFLFKGAKSDCQKGLAAFRLDSNLVEQRDKSGEGMLQKALILTFPATSAAEPAQGICPPRR